MREVCFDVFGAGTEGEDFMKLTEKKLDGATIFEGRVVKLEKDSVELENGKVSVREVIRHPGGVCVVALDSSNRVAMVRQFRYPFGKVLLEIPAGKLEKGEDPLDAVKREQWEETGTAAEEYIFLGEMYSTPGFCSEVLRIWACRITSEGESHPDEDEFLEVEYIPIETLYNMVLKGELPDAKTQIGILKTMELLKKGRI